MNKGFSTIEILIAFSLLIIALSGILLVVFGNDNFAIDAQLNQEALFFAERELNEARAASAGEGFVTFFGLATTTEDDGRYDTAVRVTDLTPCKKELTSLVSWNPTPLRNQFVRLVSQVVSIDELEALGDDCADEAREEWLHPNSYSSADIHPGGIKGTDVDVTSIGGTAYAFITSEHSSATSTDFWAFDVSNPKNPSLVSGPLNLSSGLNAIDVAQNSDGNYYAYVANASSTSNYSAEELLILNVNDPADPQLVNSFTLGITPDCSSPFSPTCPGGARAVFFSNDRVYIGTHRIGGNEFHIVDVSNPSSISGHWSYKVNHNVNKIYVRDGLAYLATSDDTGEIIILDVSNPSAGIIEVGKFDADNTNDGASVYVLGNKLYLGRMCKSNVDDLYIIDISNPATPTQIDSAELDLKPCSSGPSNSAINDIVVSSRFAFLATSDSNKEFQVWNISLPLSEGAWSWYDYPAEARGNDFFPGPNQDGDIIDIVYSATWSNDALHIIFDDPSLY